MEDELYAAMKKIADSKTPEEFKINQAKFKEMPIYRSNGKLRAYYHRYEVQPQV